MMNNFSGEPFLATGALTITPHSAATRRRLGRRWSRNASVGAMASALLLYGSASSFCQMVNPSIDPPNEPFSYFSQPTDVIGVMGEPAATLISPEGFLYTGYGELMFFTGNPPVAIAQRIKTLTDDYLPVMNYSFVREGVDYQFTAFAATLDGSPSVLVDFVRVTIRNTTSLPATAWISTGMRYGGEINTSDGYPDNRYPRPATPEQLGKYSQPGQAFDVSWKYSFGEDTVQRNGQILYYFPTSGAREMRYTLKSDVSKGSTLLPQAFNVLPTTPMGIVQYARTLRPGEKAILDWKLPVTPIAANSSPAAQVRAATFDHYLPKVIDGWRDIVQRGLDITVPEPKVNGTFKASLIYDLIALNKIGNDYIQTVNPFGYHAFYLRDCANIARMYDISGYHDYAAQVLTFFPRWQQSDGNFLTFPGQFDGIGQSLWVYGEHYRITHDEAFAKSVYPSVVRAVQWMEQARRTDPLHILPATNPHDNEMIEGHITGQNFWALDGLEAAVDLAEGTGHPQQAAEFRRDYRDYRDAMMKALDTITQKTGGYIPPGLDGPNGQDWGNMLGTYPSQILDPHDSKVTATMNTTRAKYREGVMTWMDGRFLHHYITLQNTETEIIRGDQQSAVEELYGVLLHTSSTHAGFELGILPWGDRDFGDDLSPHGWFAADYRTTLRNMMVREQEKELHLLSVISPEWAQSGKEIRVQRAPTDFGGIDFTLQFTSNTRAKLSVRSSFTTPPTRIILHLPWFMNTSQVVADGKKLEITSNNVALPVNVREVQIEWQKKSDVPPMSYERTVADYKAEYARRYKEFMQTGKR